MYELIRDYTIIKLIFIVLSGRSHHRVKRLDNPLFLPESPLQLELISGSALFFFRCTCCLISVMKQIKTKIKCHANHKPSEMFSQLRDDGSFLMILCCRKRISVGRLLQTHHRNIKI